MVVNANTKKGFSLVIVESPAKARTIGRFLGNDFVVEASIGHIRDLPSVAGEIPEKYRKEKWARLGVNVDANFEPIYVVPDEKRKQIKKLSDLIKGGAKEVYLATDEDREGEAISWHLVETLKPKVPIHRLVFHEITKKAIQDALASPRSIDNDLVQAQETRRIIDRLYGYEVSPLLWYKIRPKLSAGRVQSVAVRLIVERERERIAFRSASYWDLLGNFTTTNETNEAKPFQAGLISVGNRKIPVGKDFDPSTGQLLNPNACLLLDETAALNLVTRLLPLPAQIKSVEEKPYTERPYAPFTTSTLQQEANRKLGLTARTTMSLAQNLYENGYITYMRTDSTNLSDEAIRAARNHVLNEYGKDYLPASPRIYKTNVKNAQEAHEAIRPAGSSFELPENLKGKLTNEQFRLYDLIWKRTVASQMSDARGKRKQLIVEIDDAQFSVSGKTIEFPGYLRAYVEGSDDPDAEIADREVLLPSVRPGDVLKTLALEPKSHTTMPPSRYSEAALTKVLTDKGIGRPSTYASIIETILNRNYVFKKSGALVPTWVAFAVCQLMEKHLPDLINYDFTAQMEDQLDAISRGELGHLHYLRDFYFGAGAGEDSPSGLKPLLNHKTEEINAREVNTIPLIYQDTKAEPIVVRIGKFGPFLQQGERTGNIPEDLPPDELTFEKAMELFNNAQRAEEPLGFDPESGKPIFVKSGRFGPYVQRGNPDDEDKQNASLLKGMTPETIDLETALQLLSLPRNLGKNPANDEDILARDGKFGPYIVCGTETRSLPNGISPLEIELDQALELLAQPKFRGRRGGAGKPTEPLKAFNESPVTGKQVKLLSGRFGNYVTDGETNATLPKEITVEELTFDRALDLLAERAAKGPAPKRTARKKAVKKTTKKFVKKFVKKTVRKTTKK
ncbi:MAG: type I DNA topoisomerase [Planctomycetaceae bacterium]|jgi:DNA topoisomerase-1|nr:type I DNA topoisomerase [Planctomycetaceae bacterium]